MNVNTPTKPPEEQAEKPAETKPSETKVDRFHPAMPSIPGVSSSAHPSAQSSAGIDSGRLLQIGGVIAVILLFAGSVFWWVRSRPRGAAALASDAELAPAESPAPDVPAPVAPLHDGPTVAATVEELSKPWAARKFTFVKPVTEESVPAMVIRLPNGEFWAFSLQGPYGTCQLEYVTDLAAIASKYRYNATHPMVVSPCDGTVYDPLKVGPLGGNTWARGEIVQGSSLRPPISIDVKVRGKSIVADSIEW